MSVSTENLQKITGRGQSIDGDRERAGEKFSHNPNLHSSYNPNLESKVHENAFEAAPKFPSLPDLTLPLEQNTTISESASDEISPSYLEILQWLARILILSDDKSTEPDSLDKDNKFQAEKHPNGSSSSSAPGTQSTTPLTESKLSRELKNNLLIALHKILFADNLSETEQNASVKKMDALYTEAKLNVDLSEGFLGHPPLLVTAAHKSNWAAMKWLLENGANFSRENELVFLISEPTLYQKFKSMTDNRRKINAHFVSAFVSRYRELEKESIDKELQRQKAESEAEQKLVADITKQVETIKENVQTKYAAFCEKCRQDPKLLKQYGATLHKHLADIYQHSIIPTIGAFALFLAECKTANPRFVYAYFLGKLRKERSKPELDKAIQQLPKDVQKEANSILRFEKMCFEMVCKKIKTYIDTHRKEEMEIFDKFIPKEVMELEVTVLNEAMELGMTLLSGDPKKAKKLKILEEELKKRQAEINRQYMSYLETAVITPMIKKFDDLIEKVLAKYPDEQPAQKKIVKETFNDFMATCQNLQRSQSIPTDTMRWFYAIRRLQMTLHFCEDQLACFYKTLQDTLLKFTPKPGEMRNALSEIQSALARMGDNIWRMSPGGAPLPIYGARPPIEEGAFERQSAHAKKLLQGNKSEEVKAKADTMAMQQKKTEAKITNDREKEKKQVMNAYLLLSLEERVEFKQLLDKEVALSKSRENAVIELICKLELNKLSTVTFELNSTKNVTVNFEKVVQQFRAALRTLNITAVDIFTGDLALLKQDNLEKMFKQDILPKKDSSLIQRLSLI